MEIRKGLGKKDDFYVGNSEVKRMYVGADKVFPPYDAEIEYLESTGTQYIDSAVIDSWTGLVVMLDMLVYKTGDVGDFFGSINPSSGGYNYAGWFNSLDSFVLQIGTPYVMYGVNDNQRHLHIFDAINHTCILDETVVSASSLAWIGTGVDTFKLSQRVLSNSSILNPSHNRIFGAKFTRGNVVIADFIPVRVGTTGYLYDKVSSQLFGNQGTGDFVLGNDIV